MKKYERDSDAKRFDEIKCITTRMFCCRTLFHIITHKHEYRMSISTVRWRFSRLLSPNIVDKIIDVAFVPRVPDQTSKSVVDYTVNCPRVHYASGRTRPERSVHKATCSGVHHLIHYVVAFNVRLSDYAHDVILFTVYTECNMYEFTCNYIIDRTRARKAVIKAKRISKAF